MPTRRQGKLKVIPKVTSEMPVAKQDTSTSKSLLLPSERPLNFIYSEESKRRNSREDNVTSEEDIKTNNILSRQKIRKIIIAYSKMCENDKKKLDLSYDEEATLTEWLQIYNNGDNDELYIRMDPNDETSPVDTNKEYYKIFNEKFVNISTKMTEILDECKLDSQDGIKDSCLDGITIRELKDKEIICSSSEGGKKTKRRKQRRQRKQRKTQHKKRR